MATAPTKPQRSSSSPPPPDTIGGFAGTVLPLILAFLLGATVLGAVVYLTVLYVQRRGTENEFVFRRLEETLSFFGKEIDPRVWLAIFVPVLILGFVYAGWMYVRDGRAVGAPWATFLALLRCTAYGVLAFAFLLPATQQWEISKNTSKVLVIFDVSPSMVFLRDDVPTDTVPFDKLPTRQDKVLSLLNDPGVRFIGRLQDKNPVAAYRFGRLLDENYQWFERLDAGGLHFTKAEIDDRQRDLPAWIEHGREPSKPAWTGDDWTDWLKPRLDASVQDLPQAERDKLLKLVDENYHLFATTNIGDPLVSVLNRELNNLVQGVIVVSDGRSTEGSPAALKEATERAKKAKVPIFVIAVGEDRPRIKIEITDLRMPKQARPEDEYKVIVEINGEGLAGQEIEVFLDAYRPSSPKERFELPPVKVKFNPGQPPHAQAEFSIKPSDIPSIPRPDQPPPKPGEKGKPEFEEGEWRFVARVVKDKREVFKDAEHKTDPTSIRIVKKPISVLLFASAPSKEYQFLRTLFVREMEKGRADLCILLQPPPGRPDARMGVVQDVPPERLIKTFPDRFEDPGKGGGENEYYNLGRYDVIIGFDPDWSRLTEDQMKMIQRWVDLGHGMIVVGGPINTLQLARPGTSAQAIKSILDLYPVILEDSRIQDLERPTNEPWRLNFPGVTPEMEFMRLDESQDAMQNPLKAWEEFFYGKEAAAGAARPQNPVRGIYNYYPAKELKPSTQVIATFSDPRSKLADGKEQPYLAYMPYGAGKVFWMGSGEMWRLRGYREAYHERFWTKLARYVGSGSLTQLNRRINVLMGRTFPANTFIPIDAQILSKEMKPLDEKAKPKLILTPPAGTLAKETTLEMSKKLSTAEGWNGYFTTRFLARTPGEYQYRIEVTETGDTESGKFLVKESNPELDNTRPDFEQLYELASEADDYLIRIKDEALRKRVKDSLGRPRTSEEKAAEKKPETPTDDRPRFYFELKTAELIPDCVSYDYREQRSRGAAEDWWDSGYPPGDRDKRWFSWTLALVVGLLSAEWLARKLLRLA
jgi:hypothetical protein